ALSSAAAAVEPPTSVALVHKKVNISDARVPWQHELFSRRKLVAASLSALPSAPRFLRHWGGLADTRASVNERQLLAATRLIAEAIASHIFNSSSTSTASGNPSEGGAAAAPPIAFFPPNSSLAPSLPYLSHWLSLLSRVPRVAPLLAKDDPIIAAIQAVRVSPLSERMGSTLGEIFLVVAVNVSSQWRAAATALTLGDLFRILPCAPSRI
ncbi:unnamed protein product, partial [Closterium sp. NIES-53]